MHVTMHTIAHKEQRYDTVGDWHFDMNGDLIIKVSKMSDPRYETLVAVHELVEAVLCKQDGISEAAVDAFDLDYAGHFDEPGDDPHAPYHQQHWAASFFEWELAQKLGVDWGAYEAEVMSK